MDAVNLERLAAMPTPERSPFPTATEQRDIHWTAKWPRPTRATYPDRVPSLEQAQETWDRAEAQRVAHVEAVERLQADREKREDAERKKYDDHIARIKQDQQATILASLKRGYLANGGTEQQFEQDKDELLREHAKRAALAGVVAESGEIRPLADVRRMTA